MKYLEPGRTQKKGVRIQKKGRRKPGMDSGFCLLPPGFFMDPSAGEEDKREFRKEKTWL
jgi:hypothetical protein